MKDQIYKHHPTGLIGFFTKEYKPTGRRITMQIKLVNNKIYFAPKHEFKQLT